jgi:hypothetical protein
VTTRRFIADSRTNLYGGIIWVSIKIV